MFIYLKRQIKLTFSRITQEKRYIGKNITSSLHSLIKIYSDFLFRRSLLIINLIIYSFSVRHNWQVIELVFQSTFNAIEYLMVKMMLLRFNCQLYLANSMLFSYFSCLKSLAWFMYLSLRGAPVKLK